jgi:transglycosylase-like protein with SLT domain
MMLKRINDIFVFSLFGFFKISLFLSLFYFFIVMLSKSEHILYNESIKNLIVLSNPMLRAQNREFFYSDIQETKSSLEDLREETDILKCILKFSNQISYSDALRLSKLIKEECENYGLDPFLILAVIEVESEFSPRAVSPKGAIGLMQIMPETAEFIGGELGGAVDGTKSLYNPFVNVRFGIYYISYLINRFNSIEWALVAYNTGPNNFLTSQERIGKRLPDYVKKVISFKNWLEAGRTAAEQS